MATGFLERTFKLKENDTHVKREVSAGMATFLTMAYIVVVNPHILGKAGMPFSGVLFATVLVSAVSSIAMGLYANLPYAVAPGMGINAFFAYQLVVTMGIRWEVALGAVFLAGILFLLLSMTRARTEIVRAIPVSIRLGMAAGIGAFLSLIGFSSVGFVVPSEATTVAFGGLNTITILFLVGLFGTAVLVAKGVRGAFTLSIVGMSLLHLAISQLGPWLGWEATLAASVPKHMFSLPSAACLLQLDIPGALTRSMLLPVFALLFVDLFDSIGTFVGVAEVAGFVEKDGTPIRMEKALLVDAFSTTVSGLVGSSAGTVYVESVSGIKEGGRTGLTVVITGLLFLPFMFISPLLSFVPAVATAPVLVLAGVFMTRPLLRIDWENFEEAFPAFLTFILIPLTFNITQGVIWGFLAYTIVKIALGKGKAIHWMVYLIDLFILLELLSIYFC